MRHWAIWGLGLVCLGNVCLAADEADDTRYRNLLHELRCLVCQNQSLADSDAELAGDLRQRVRKLVEQGLSDEQVVAYLQARYGDFILYRPPLAPRTIILWTGPFLLLILAILLLLRQVRRAHVRASRGLSDAERERIAEILKRGEG